MLCVMIAKSPSKHDKIKLHFPEAFFAGEADSILRTHTRKSKDYIARL